MLFEYNLNNHFCRSYIDIRLLEISVEGKDNEGSVALQRGDGQEQQEHYKVYGLMQHCPESQPGEPSYNQS